VLQDALAADEAATAPSVVRMHQVHGADVHTVRASDTGPGAEPPVADGLVTDLTGVALLVRVADCVPVLLADPAAGVLGAAHAGRNGLLHGVVPATVARMRDLGAREVTAWVGPHICGACYEVPAELREDVAARVPEAFAETSWGTPAVDVGAGVLAQLRSEGVEVRDVAGCTREREDLHSHRRDGASAGRLGGLVWSTP
jgi:YfiH family protein